MLRKTGFALLLILWAVSPLFGQQWATKMFQEASHDFGSVARGAKVEHEFVLSNIYLEDVHITGVRSSCGCTTPRIAKPLLKTYENGAIVAAFNTKSYRGRRTATLTVSIDKPFRAEVQLHVKGYIRSDVVLTPDSIQLGTIDQGKPAKKRISVSYAGRSNWRILEVRSNNPNLSGTVFERSRRGGQVAYELAVNLDENAPVGYLKDHLTLVTNDRERPEVPVMVEGRILSGITVSPSALFMGVVEPGNKVTKRLVVRSKKPFRILSIDCDDASFEFDTSLDQIPKSVHVVPVTFIAGEKLGRVTKMIRIETDMGEQITPELAAYAVVSSP